VPVAQHPLNIAVEKVSRIEPALESCVWRIADFPQKSAIRHTQPSRKQMVKYRDWAGEFIDANPDGGAKARRRIVKQTKRCSSLTSILHRQCSDLAIRLPSTCEFSEGAS